MAAYWPEFAEAGKAAITVRQVLAHQAGLDIRYSAGFLKPCPACPFGSSDRAFGAGGAGGAFGFADPDLGLGYAYAPNRMGFHMVDDPREQTPRAAVYRCLGIQPRTPRRNG